GARVSDRLAGRQSRPGRGHLALPVSDAGSRRVPAASLHPEGVSVASASSRRTARWQAVATYANLAPFVFFALFPFYFMFVTSFKSNAELYNLKSVPFWIQTGVIADHYAYLFKHTEFFAWIRNTLIVSVLATTTSVGISILAGYSLARLRYRGAATFGTAIFITYL